MIVDNEQAVKLWQDSPNSRRWAIEQLIQNNYGLIHKYAVKTRDVRSNYLDFKQHVVPYIQNAADGFDLSRGLKFISYFVWHLKAAITDFNRHEGTIKPVLRKGKIVDFDTCSLNIENEYGQEHINLIEDTREPEKESLKYYSDTILGLLTVRERRIFSMFFGLQTGIPRSMSEIGQEMNLCRERVRQIKADAIKKVRAKTKMGNLQGTGVFQEMHSLYSVRNPSFQWKKFLY